MAGVHAVLVGMAAVCVIVGAAAFAIGLRVGFEDGVKFGSKTKMEG